MGQVPLATPLERRTLPARSAVPALGAAPSQRALTRRCRGRVRALEVNGARALAALHAEQRALLFILENEAPADDGDEAGGDDE